jgi:hypothetical protein
MAKMKKQVQKIKEYNCEKQKIFHLSIKQQVIMQQWGVVED